MISFWNIAKSFSSLTIYTLCIVVHIIALNIELLSHSTSAPIHSQWIITVLPVPIIFSQTSISTILKHLNFFKPNRQGFTLSELRCRVITFMTCTNATAHFDGILTVRENLISGLLSWDILFCFTIHNLCKLLWILPAIRSLYDSFLK